jgi:plasmid stabilization system
MESKYSYQFTKSAKNDLEQILHYIKIDLGNPTAAFSFMNKFQEAVSNIQLFANSCPKVINKFLSESIIIRKKLISNYVLYYSVNDNLKSIIILRIVFSHRDIDSILKNEN